MAKISDLLAQGRTISFEFFPPKTPVGVDNLMTAVAELTPANPSFMSVTYGAGGSTRDLTAELVIDMNATHDFPVMAHLTCVGHTHDQVEGAARPVRRVRGRQHPRPRRRPAGRRQRPGWRVRARL